MTPVAFQGIDGLVQPEYQMLDVLFQLACNLQLVVPRRESMGLLDIGEEAWEEKVVDQGVGNLDILRIQVALEVLILWPIQAEVSKDGQDVPVDVLIFVVRRLVDVDRIETRCQILLQFCHHPLDSFL